MGVILEFRRPKKKFKKRDARFKKGGYHLHRYNKVDLALECNKALNELEITSRKYKTDKENSKRRNNLIKNIFFSIILVELLIITWKVFH